MYAIAEYRGYHTGYIARKLYIEHCALKKCIDSLGGYVKIHKNFGDKKATYPALTREGAQLLKKIMPILLEMEKGIGIITYEKDFFIRFIHEFSTEMVRRTLNVKQGSRKCQ